MQTLRHFTHSAALIALLGSAQSLLALDLVRVIDGDTIIVRDAGRNVHLRAAGVDAPEMKQPAGPAAKAFTESICIGQPVTYRRVAIDRYHRTVAHIRCGHQDLSQALKRSGHVKKRRR